MAPRRIFHQLRAPWNLTFEMVVFLNTVYNYSILGASVAIGPWAGPTEEFQVEGGEQTVVDEV